MDEGDRQWLESLLLMLAPLSPPVGNLQNIGNTIIFPQIPGFSRKPVVTLPTVESTGEKGKESKRAEER